MVHAFIFSFNFLKSLRKRTHFFVGLGCAKYGAPHSESFSTPSTPNRTKFSTSFLDIYSCNFVTGYFCEHIFFTLSFNSESTGSGLQIPSVPFYNSSNICNNVINSLRCVIVKCWHWVSITLCKFAFSYLASNITRNHFVAVRTFSDSYNSLT